MKYILLSALILVFAGFTLGQLNMQQLGHLSYSDELSDVWGYVDSEGNEYALVGTFSGLSIVDVTNPAIPVEVFFGPGAGSIWRDIKTWGDFAYVSNEANGGVYIVDLSPLPGPVTTTTSFTGLNYSFSSAHNLYIDETGKLYIFGADNGSGGAIICDLTQDPMSPVELGRFDNFYLHDGMARGDTLWGAAIYQGVLAAIDVSEPSSPQIMGSVNTPGNFSHNAWVSDDGSHVFTTDEVSSGYIGAYDVTDLSNIIETDRVQTAPGTGVIPHNTHVINDYLVTSYYTEGITIHDALFPDNIIEVGHFDTSPNYAGIGYNGSWGAYPFLPSGNILASDMEEGLYILQPSYIRAVHITGTVTDSITDDPLFNVQYEVIGTEISGQTAFDGTFSFGTLESGTYDMQFIKDGYETKTIHDVEFLNGQLTNLEVKMSLPSITGTENPVTAEILSLFPNPFQGQLNIQYNFNRPVGAAASIEVFDLTGSRVYKSSLIGQNGTLAIGNELQQGIYFVKISDGNTMIETRRVIKK
ncbi:MAG: choice-of-anchor B family protein [Bacteroidales bacterium]|nr:choice-of-anchor B family protein [Bacteroidales bacterium]